MPSIFLKQFQNLTSNDFSKSKFVSSEESNHTIIFKESVFFTMLDQNSLGLSEEIINKRKKIPGDSKMIDNLVFVDSQGEQLVLPTEFKSSFRSKAITADNLVELSEKYKGYVDAYKKAGFSLEECYLISFKYYDSNKGDFLERVNDHYKRIRLNFKNEKEAYKWVVERFKKLVLDNEVLLSNKNLSFPANYELIISTCKSSYEGHRVIKGMKNNYYKID